MQFPVGQWLTWGAFTYPLAFLVSDIVNRLEGARAARRVVYAGFVVGLGFSVVGSVQLCLEVFDKVVMIALFKRENYAWERLTHLWAYHVFRIEILEIDL